MAKCSELRPMLGVADPQRTVAFYCDRLGFRVCARFEHDGRLCWAHLARDKAEFMITGPISALQEESARKALGCVILYLSVDDVRAFREESVASGVEVCEPVQRFYGMLEVELRDPDGYTILVGEDTGEEWDPHEA